MAIIRAVWLCGALTGREGGRSSLLLHSAHTPGPASARGCPPPNLKVPSTLFMLSMEYLFANHASKVTKTVKTNR